MTTHTHTHIHTHTHTHTHTQTPERIQQHSVYITKWLNYGNKLKIILLN